MRTSFSPLSHAAIICCALPRHGGGGIQSVTAFSFGYPYVPRSPLPFAASFATSDSSTRPNLIGRSTFRFQTQRQNNNNDAWSSRPRMTVDSSAEGTANNSSSSVTVADNPDLDVYRNRNNIRDQVFSAISANGEIKVTAATVRNLVNEFMLMHTMTAVPADALGRATVCTLLLSNGMPEDHTFQLTIAGDGPLRSCIAISNGAGEVRGYCGNPGIGEMPLQEAVGKGTVQVVKNHPDWPNPYNGITAIRNADIDSDVGIYLAESEQRSCALAAATAVNGILCTAAGGYLVEQLPGCSKETIQRVEQNLAKLVEMDGGDKLPTNLILNGVTPLDIAGIILDGLDMQPLQQMDPQPKCSCSEERLFRSLRLLPREEVDQILEKQEQIEARCQFCGKVYRMGPDEVLERFVTAEGDPSKDNDVDL